ncbi:MAG: serine acetyltransferase [Bacteroidetes bacterium]|nr:serine acetyltransferase [Bacteroidota bacterium]
MGIFQDWNANKRNFKGRFVLVLFRMAVAVKKNKILLVFLFPYLIFYRFCVEWVLGIEITWNVSIGKNCGLYHGQGTVINPGTRIGSDCIIRQNTTIGSKGDGAPPVIGNFVDIGANSCIIGSIHIGDHVVIGAGSIVVKDVESNSVVAGNPAKLLKRTL